MKKRMNTYFENDSEWEWRRLTVGRGYRWIEGVHADSHKPDKFLVELEEFEGNLSNKKIVHTNYRPMQIPNLFVEFSRTEQNSVGVLSFCEKYGLLGYDERGLSSVNKLFVAESLSSWIRNIRELSVAYNIWAALNFSDEELALQKYVESIQTFNKDNIRNADPRIESYNRLVSDKAEHYKMIYEAYEGDIQEYILTQLTYHMEDNLKNVFQAFVDMRDDYSGISIQFKPDSLIGYIWYQFAKAVMFGEQWRLCDFCGEPFEFKNKKAQYCSDSHRQLAYQKRKGSGK